ncbi:uncharacterized protein DS421_1g18890 [Arachis hypogaea]|nr:uncharacterized protein DS421_1g18890 [Arachis hypogaea]
MATKKGKEKATPNPQQGKEQKELEFYSNFHLPTLQSVYIRQKQVPITEEAIQRALDLPPAPEGLDAFQKAAIKRQAYTFDWDAILRVIAQPGSKWIFGYHRSRPKRSSASTLTLEAHVWAQIMSHYVFPSTHESSFTADMAVLLWCILTDQPLNLPRHIRNAMEHVQIVGNLPFPALVFDLISAAGVSYRAGDTKAILPRDDQYVPNGRYLRSQLATTSQSTEDAAAPPPSTSQLLHQILKRLDQQEKKAKL